MNIIISGKNFSLSEANKEFIEEKVSHLIKYDETITKIGVEIDADKKIRDHQKFRVELWADGRRHAKAGGHGYSFFDALEAALHKLKRQLIKLKEKKRPQL